VGSPKLGRTSRLVEDETLERIRHTLEGGIEGGGLRDDAAAVAVPDGGPVIVSVDSVVDGVHVDLALCSPHDVGWKALMGALSDLAAMGARPIGALVALCVPEAAGGGEMTLGVMEGVAEASQASGCPVVGGDVSDVILVTGPCGGSAAGLRVLRSGAGLAGLPEVAGLDPVEAALAAAYRRPVARLAEGEAARRAGASAMIDVSDGLALDLHRLADASGVGFMLDSVPVAEGATPDDALGGGEDYELVVVIGAGRADACARSWAGSGLRPLHRIGVVTGDPTQRTLQGRALAQLGWQHRLG
jgi:thiamine-monophosphate kinase